MYFFNGQLLLPNRKETKRKKMKTLPAHLQEIANKVEKNNAEFTKLGGDINWHKDALDHAEKTGNDNNLIHAMIPA